MASETINLGKVKFTLKGTFSPTVSYEQFDLVDYNGSSYIAKQKTVAGTLPTNTAYWALSAKGIDVDLTNYVKNTDYANGNKAGVIKTGVGTQATATGFLSSVIYDYETYKTRGTDTFIGKGTLENVITGKKLVNEDTMKNYVDSLDSEEVSY